MNGTVAVEIFEIQGRVIRPKIVNRLIFMCMHRMFRYPGGRHSHGEARAHRNALCADFSQFESRIARMAKRRD